MDAVSERYVDHVGGMSGAYVAPSAGGTAACVVIGGSAGGLTTSRRLAERLAASGVAALGLAYHGIDLRPTLQDVPLEGFVNAARWLGERSRLSTAQVALMGLSRGSEAAMLVGALCTDACGPVVGVVPGNVVCGSWPPGSAAWLLDGRALPSVNRFGPTCADPAAVIPVERISSLLLVSAGQDEVWPSGSMAEAIVARRARHGVPTEHLHRPDASHRSILAPEHGRAEDADQGGGGAWSTIVGYLYGNDRS